MEESGIMVIINSQSDEPKKGRQKGWLPSLKEEGERWVQGRISSLPNSLQQNCSMEYASYHIKEVQLQGFPWPATPCTPTLVPLLWYCIAFALHFAGMVGVALGMDISLAWSPFALMQLEWEMHLCPVSAPSRGTGEGRGKDKDMTGNHTLGTNGMLDRWTGQMDRCQEHRMTTSRALPPQCQHGPLV